MLKYFLDNNLISPKQSRFRHGDSFLLILFLDISKAFKKLWHDELTYKVQQNEKKHKLLCIVMDILKYR